MKELKFDKDKNRPLMQISFVIDEFDYKKLSDMKHKHKVKMSQLMRAIIKSYLEEK